MKENTFTWLTKIWIVNDESSYWHYSNLASDLYALELGDADAVTSALADAIKDDIEMDMPLNSASFYSDCLSHAINQIDFWDIARGFLEDVGFYDSAKKEAATL